MEYPFKSLMPLDEATARDGYYKDWTHINPSVFHQITELSNFVREKGFGVDVREAIAQALERVYHDATLSGNANAEVSHARGSYGVLKDRLDAGDAVGLNALTTALKKIEKGVGGVGMSDLGQDVKTAMTGGSVAVVGPDSVLTENIVNKSVTRSKLNDKYSLNPDISSGTDLDAVTADGIHTGRSAGTYPNAPSSTSGRNFILKVEPSYASGTPNRYYMQTIIDLAPPFRTYERFLDNQGILTTGWNEKLGDKSITRQKLSDDFMNNYNYIPANGDISNAISQGNYIAIAGAKSTPLTGETFSVRVDVFRTTPAGNAWLTQTATTTDGNLRSFMRKKYANQTFGEWVELTNLEGSSHKLAGKNILCFGDSFTENGDYPQRIASKTGANVTSIGFGGCRMTRYAVDSVYTPMCMSKLSEYIASGDFTELEAAAQELFETNGDDNRPQVARLKATDFSKVDYITIFHGTNDYGGNMPVGADTDMTYDTFKGAINLVIENIMTAHPHIKLLFISPFWRATYTGVSERVDSDTYPNPLGHYLIEYVDALLERTGANHVPALDMYRSGGINKYNYEHWLGDGLHPRVGIGYEYVTNKILAGFESVY